MAPALAPIPPLLFKRILELAGFKLAHETATNWTLINESAPRPVIVIPKEGALVSIALMMNTLDQLKIDNGKYFTLLKLARN